MGDSESEASSLYDSPAWASFRAAAQEGEQGSEADGAAQEGGQGSEADGAVEDGKAELTAASEVVPSETDALVAADLTAACEVSPFEGDFTEALEAALLDGETETKKASKNPFKQREHARRRALRKAQKADDVAAMQEEVDKQHAEQGFILKDKGEPEHEQKNKKILSLQLIAEERKQAAEETRQELRMQLDDPKQCKKQASLSSFFEGLTACLPSLPTPKDFCSMKGYFGST